MQPEASIWGRFISLPEAFIRVNAVDLYFFKLSFRILVEAADPDLPYVLTVQNVLLT
jgi:hypothetical protein